MALLSFSNADLGGTFGIIIRERTQTLVSTNVLDVIKHSQEKMNSMHTFE